MLNCYQFKNKVAISILLAGMVANAYAEVEPPPVDQPFDQLIVKLKPPVKLRKGTGSRPAGTQPLKLIDRLDAVLSRVQGQAQTSRLMSPSISSTADVPNTAVGMTTKKAINSNIGVVALGRSVTAPEVQQLINDIAQDTAVEYVVPDAILYPANVPNDPGYSRQWGYSEAGGGAKLESAWDHTVGSESIVVAVIDTGYLPHADLQANLLPGYDFISNAKRANRDNLPPGSNGMDSGDWLTADDAKLEPFSVWRCRPQLASSWHGTHVAGTVGAISNNGLGVTGVSWNGKILPVRVLGKCGGATSDIITGMLWAAGLDVDGTPKNTHPARVLNLSLGGPSPACSPAFADAIKAIKAKGDVSIVVAAGNSGAPVANSQPANCAGVIAVGAIDKAGGRPDFGNYGSGVTISAPGVEIWSTLNMGEQSPKEDAYAAYNGTSMAAPHVAGTIALMLALNPNLTDAKITEILQSSHKKFPAGSNCLTPQPTCGAGLLDAGEAIKQVVPLNRAMVR